MLLPAVKVYPMPPGAVLCTDYNEKSLPASDPNLGKVSGWMTKISVIVGDIYNWVKNQNSKFQV